MASILVPVSVFVPTASVPALIPDIISGLAAMSIEDSTDDIINTFFGSLSPEETAILMEFTLMYNPLRVASDTVPVGIVDTVACNPLRVASDAVSTNNTIACDPLRAASDAVPVGAAEFPISYIAVIVDPYDNSPAHYSSPRSFGCGNALTRRFPADRHMPY